MRRLTIGTALFLFCGMAASPQNQPAAQSQQEPSQGTTTLQVRSQLVLVPTEVRTHSGDEIYTLTADKFVIEDNGVRQRVRLDDSGMVQPLSLVVAVQCSRTAFAEMDKMRGLDTMIDAVVGAAPAEVAVIQFGTGEDLVSKFETDPAKRNAALNRVTPCEDGGSTIYDAVEYAGQILEAHHAKGRRVVLLVSETRDHGSEAKAEHVIEQLARSNVVVDSLSFSPMRDAIVDDVKHTNGASGGLIGLLWAAVQALRTNAPKTLANMSGGEYMNFASQKGFDKNLLALANHVNNYYSLSFQPRFPANAEGSNLAQPGLHKLKVYVPDYPDAKIRFRESYWADGPMQTETQPAK
jgi:VWFA-related protein